MLTRFKYIFPSIILVFLITLISCEKRIGFYDEEEPIVVIPPVSGNGTVQELKDSIYYYYKLYSLWESSIPVYNPISKFTESIGSPSQVLDELMSMTPAFGPYSSSGGTYDRFSFMSGLNGFNSNSSRLVMDTNQGFGLYYSIGAINDSIAYPIIKMVEGGSAPSIAGLRRSDRILAVDGQDLKIEVECVGGECKAVVPSRLSAVTSILNNASNASQMILKVQKVNDEIKTYTIQSNTYDIDPLLADTVFEFSNKNVGYFAYSSFEEIENNNLNQRKIDDMFDHFESKNIKALIVDLRYNGGGYVDAAVYIADKIINTSGKNRLMFKYGVNDYLELTKSQSYSKFDFDDVFYSKTSNLELETVCFIVSKNTASASEMLINVLKPYMNVKLIAEKESTYGKPVGFFGQRIMNRVDLWVTSFKLLNAANEADYWTGILGDVTNIDDYIFLDFGVKEERMIAAAVNLTGAISPSFRMRSVTPSRGLMKMMDVNTVPHKGALKTR